MSPRFSSGGLSTFDLLGDLSPAERTLTRIFLRHASMTENEILDAIAALPEAKQLSKTEMQAALKSLAEKGWLQIKKTGFKKTYTIQQQKHHQ